jgi:hypothetical protein
VAPSVPHTRTTPSRFGHPVAQHGLKYVRTSRKTIPQALDSSGFPDVSRGGLISWKAANGLSRRDVAAINLSKVTVLFLSFLFLGIHSRPPAGKQARWASPPLRGIVLRQVDDVKTIYSQKQMSINGEVLEVHKVERGPIFRHSSDFAVVW